MATVTEKSTTGLEPNLAAALAYLTVPAIIFLAMEKDSPFVRYHSFQALFLALAWVVFWIVLTVFGMIPVIGWLTIPIWLLGALAFFVIWLFAIVKAFTGEKFKLPIIGDMAEQQISK
jgi:uncharacterized membrane protein